MNNKNTGIYIYVRIKDYTYINKCFEKISAIIVINMITRIWILERSLEFQISWSAFSFIRNIMLWLNYWIYWWCYRLWLNMGLFSSYKSISIELLVGWPANRYLEQRNQTELILASAVILANKLNHFSTWSFHMHSKTVLSTRKLLKLLALF